MDIETPIDEHTDMQTHIDVYALAYLLTHSHTDSFTYSCTFAVALLVPSSWFGCEHILHFHAVQLDGVQDTRGLLVAVVAMELLTLLEYLEGSHERTTGACY